MYLHTGACRDSAAGLGRQTGVLLEDAEARHDREAGWREQAQAGTRGRQAARV